jgi:hypothetical protein
MAESECKAVRERRGRYGYSEREEDGPDETPESMNTLPVSGDDLFDRQSAREKTDVRQLLMLLLERKGYPDQVSFI